MELENEKKTEEQSSEQNATSREGYTNQTSGYQGYKLRTFTASTYSSAGASL